MLAFILFSSLTIIGCKSDVTNDTQILDDNSEIGSLIYYNSKLYRLPDNIFIDYQWDGSILGTVDKIVDETEIPKEDFTTNDDELLNTIIVSEQDYYIIIKGIEYKMLIEVK